MAISLYLSAPSPGSMLFPGNRGTMPVVKHEGKSEHFSNSIRQFCNFINFSIQEEMAPSTFLQTVELRAEAVRLVKKDFSPDCVDLLFDTLLNSMNYLKKELRKEIEAHTPSRTEISQDAILQIVNSIRAALPEQQTQENVQEQPKYSLWRKILSKK